MVRKTSSDRVLSALMRLNFFGYFRARGAKSRSPSGTSLKSPMTMTGTFFLRARENSLSKSRCNRSTVLGQ